MKKILCITTCLLISCASVWALFCPQCGGKNPDDAKFCMKCGEKVPVVGQTTTKTAKVKKATVKKTVAEKVKRPASKIDVAVDLIYGNGTAVDYRTGRQIVLSESAAGDPVAQLVHACLLNMGYAGIQKDIPQSHALGKAALKKVIELEGMGGMVGQTHAALTMLCLDNSQKDADAAMALLEKCAAQGDSSAMLNLGARYCSKHPKPHKYVTADDSKAVHWTKKAVENDSAWAMHNLSIFYAHGIGVRQSYSKFAQYTKMASERGVPDAVGNLGYCYAEGVGGTPKSKKKGYELTALADKMGVSPDNQAMINMNLKQYRKAANRGDLMGMVNAVAKGLGIAKRLDHVISGKHKGRKFIGKGSPPVNSFDANNKPNEKYFKWAYGD